ncbi:MAG: hypothetical protein CMF46_02140 [Legionellales bacterium]|nr:hypothetical protein [Legionellales bacterium]
MGTLIQQTRTLITAVLTHPASHLLKMKISGQINRDDTSEQKKTPPIRLSSIRQFFNTRLQRSHLSLILMTRWILSLIGNSIGVPSPLPMDSCGDDSMKSTGAATSQLSFIAILYLIKRSHFPEPPIKPTDPDQLKRLSLFNKLTLLFDIGIELLISSSQPRICWEAIRNLGLLAGFAIPPVFQICILLPYIISTTEIILFKMRLAIKAAKPHQSTPNKTSNRLASIWCTLNGFHTANYVASRMTQLMPGSVGLKTVLASSAFLSSFCLYPYATSQLAKKFQSDSPDQTNRQASCSTRPQ